MSLVKSLRWQAQAGRIIALSRMSLGRTVPAIKKSAMRPACQRLTQQRFGFGGFALSEQRFGKMTTKTAIIYPLRIFLFDGKVRFFGCIEVMAVRMISCNSSRTSSLTF